MPKYFPGIQTQATFLGAEQYSKLALCVYAECQFIIPPTRIENYDLWQTDKQNKYYF